jgi:hypothetical protein
VSISQESDSLGVGYSDKISQNIGLPKPQTLFIPSISTEIVSVAKTPRDKVSVYLGKHRDFKNISFVFPRNSVLLYRNGRRKLPREQMLETIAQSNYLIVFENTSVILESLLVGTPVQTVFNEDFQYLFSEDELGTYGCFEKIDDLAKARDEIETFKAKYESVLRGLDSKVTELGKLIINNAPYSGSQLRMPPHLVLVLMHNTAMFRAALKKVGITRTFHISLRRLGALK